MKMIYFVLILLMVIGQGVVQASQSRFYITTSTTNEIEQTYMDHFQGFLVNLILEKFPCASIQTESNVVVLLNRERERQIVGVGAENAIENIGESLKNDYLICLRIRDINGTVNIVAVCFNSQRSKGIARVSLVVKEGEVLNAVEKASEQIVDGLKELEICPFQGKVDLTINSVFDSTSKEDYSVYCNGMDQRYHKEIVIKNQTQSKWNLQRVETDKTDGTMTFYSNEESIITEENGCYTCKSGREGGRTYSETKTMKVKGSGISHESIRNNKIQDDTWVELKFLENGTYLLIAKGTSQPAKGEDKMVSSAVGTCDNIPQETKVEPREISIPLKVIFGPYSGKTTDKILQQKETKETIDPVTKEKTTITIDFSLTKKGK